jgi:hypothetical protein
MAAHCRIFVMDPHMSATLGFSLGPSLIQSIAVLRPNWKPNELEGGDFCAPKEMVLV